MISPRHMSSRALPMMPTTSVLVSCARATELRASRKSPARRLTLLPRDEEYIRWAAFPRSVRSYSSSTSSWITCAVTIISTISANCSCFGFGRTEDPESETAELASGDACSSCSGALTPRARAMRRTVPGRQARSRRSKNSRAASCRSGFVEPSRVLSLPPPTWVCTSSLMCSLRSLRSPRTSSKGSTCSEYTRSSLEAAPPLLEAEGVAGGLAAATSVAVSTVWTAVGDAGGVIAPEPE
mmetsp:Transcript_9274/g.20972  ORF Transcript_9274/g.20972 Transcript_9274/m.20972 type:complete len:240 (-) Transcript_9274:246-965(-)